jgi:hypothetical protein
VAQVGRKIGLRVFFRGDETNMTMASLKIAVKFM